MPDTVKPFSIEFEGVSFSYGETEILHNITFQVEQGDYLGLIGPNGGGKSTLLKIMLGLLKPQTGTVKLFGVPLDEFHEMYRIGYVPQRIAQGDIQFPATVDEVVESGRTARNGIFSRLSKEDARNIHQAMEAADVVSIRHELVGNLSGGQRQRVFIARALATSPKMLILDEPSVGVDVTSQERFYQVLKRLNEKMGITIMFVSHDINAVAHEVKTIMCLNRSLRCHGDPYEVITDEHLKGLYGKDIKMILHGH